MPSNDPAIDLLNGNSAKKRGRPKNSKVVSIRPSDATKADQVEDEYHVGATDTKGHGQPVRLHVNPGHMRLIRGITAKHGSPFADGEEGFIRWAIKRALEEWDTNHEEISHSLELQTAIDIFDHEMANQHYLKSIMERKGVVREVYDGFLTDGNYQDARDHVRKVMAWVQGWPESPSRRDFLAWLHREFDGEIEDAAASDTDAAPLVSLV